jgi:acyl-CoA reductase-like NAD-dependent aldehyde dehydrogenase
MTTITAEALRSTEAPSPLVAAMHAARSAQRTWSTVTVRDRLAVIRRLRHRLAREPDTLAKSLRLPQRTRLFDSLSAEVLPLAEACRFLENEAASLLATRKLSNRSRPWWGMGHRIRVARDPLGLVLIIGPSNYPLMLAGVQLLQALVAGNAVVLKPGQRGEEACQLLVDWLIEAGLDRRLVVVTDSATEHAERAIQEGVDKIVLTGSVRSGRAVLKSAADSLTPAILELSGSDAVFVLPDADVDRVVAALAFGLRLNGGETCIAPRRVFVPKSMQSAIVEPLLAAARKLPPMPVYARAAELAEEIIDEAMAAGAERLLGGETQSRDEESVLFSPTILLDPPADSRLMTSDLFVPVMAIKPVDKIEDALALAQESGYKLGASVFGPTREAEDFAKRVDAGSITINDMIAPTADPRFPFGGRGLSGYGVTRGAEGLLELTQLKAMVTQTSRWLPHLDPPASTDDDLARGLIRALHGGSFWDRLGGWRQLIGAVMRRKPPSTD